MNADIVQAAVHVLAQHGRVPLRELARLVGRPPNEVRAQIEAFNDVEREGSPLEPLFLLTPAGGWPDSGPDPEPSDDDVVSFSPRMSGGDLGLAHTDAATLGPLLAAAEELRCLEPGNLVLASAVEVLRSSLLRSVTGRAASRARWAALLQAAADQCRAVRITYSSAWAPRVRRRTIHPYRVVSTTRGYEVDAGPLDELGRPRTYLLARIRDYAVLDERFEVPEDLEAALATNRRLTPVRGVAPHARMWAIRHWSERIDQGDADAEDVSFTAWVLPPVPERVALMSLVAGPGVDLDDQELDRAVRTRAHEMLVHHGL